MRRIEDDRESEGFAGQYGWSHVTCRLWQIVEKDRRLMTRCACSAGIAVRWSIREKNVLEISKI